MTAAVLLIAGGCWVAGCLAALSLCIVSARADTRHD